MKLRRPIRLVAFRTCHFCSLDVAESPAAPHAAQTQLLALRWAMRLRPAAASPDRRRARPRFRSRGSDGNAVCNSSSPRAAGGRKTRSALRPCHRHRDSGNRLARVRASETSRGRDADAAQLHRRGGSGRDVIRFRSRRLGVRAVARISLSAACQPSASVDSRRRTGATSPIRLPRPRAALRV